MRVTRTLVLLALASLGLPLTAAGQTADSPAPHPAPVIIQERSPALAAVLDVFVPTAGFAYAGSWKRGLPSGAVRVVGIALTAEHIVGTPLGSGVDCEASCVLGQVLLVGGTIWAGWDAAATARRNNERDRARALGVTVAPSTTGGVQVGLRLASPF